MSILRAFFTALAFCTIVPIPGVLQERERSLYLLFLPVAGLVIGALTAIVANALLLFGGPMLGAFLTIAFYCVLTGCLHVDGLADCADGFYGKRPREKVLEIMKDPRIGTMASVAVGLALLGRYAAFANIKASSLVSALPVCFMFSRSLPLLFPLVADYARSQGILAYAALPPKPVLFIVAFICAGSACAFFPFACGVSLACGIGFIAYCIYKTGGYTGDCMGAVIELSEIIFLIMLALVERNG